MNRAEQLARKLIEIYTMHKIPEAAKLNRKYEEGFTRDKIEGDTSALFQMIVLAAYDRRPFTIIAKGWEPIWGLIDTGPSLPAILRNAGLYQLAQVLTLSKEDMERRLANCRFFKYRLDSDGAKTRYCRTFKDAAELVSIRGLLSLMQSATTASEVKKIYELIDGVHGIGPTITSKLIMYTLREIGVGNIDPRELYPAVKPILIEYHNARLTKELIQLCQQPDIVEQIFEALKVMGDPFAIDALYYIDRNEPALKKRLMSWVDIP
jgi:hypothetical protein